ncbi:unnamed protein product [Symbiodinium natans]|uniref:Uncharacterized protein n=1 Tax=Symbiodinium natans TaxID=878477 RepID=A0A812II35_9DINO|nr:unnamed protein product [Symbiodinium natans]
MARWQGFLGPRLLGNPELADGAMPAGSALRSADAADGQVAAMARPAPLQAPHPNGDVRSMVREAAQTVAASVPQRAAAPQAPVQLIIQNSSTVTTSQVPETPPEPPKMPQHMWELSRKDLVEFWMSPLNRICLLGLAGFLLWIYHGNTQHKWRMSELQRRIDSNPFTKLVAMAFGPSSWPR